DVNEVHPSKLGGRIQASSLHSMCSGTPVLDARKSSKPSKSDINRIYLIEFACNSLAGFAVSTNGQTGHFWTVFTSSVCYSKWLKARSPTRPVAVFKHDSNACWTGCVPTACATAVVGEDLGPRPPPRTPG